MSLQQEPDAHRAELDAEAPPDRSLSTPTKDALEFVPLPDLAARREPTTEAAR